MKKERKEGKMAYYKKGKSRKTKKSGKQKRIFFFK